MAGIMRVFSGSCIDLDDHDLAVMPHADRVEQKHELDTGADFFDESGRPLQPHVRTMNKVFSGSKLDLCAANAEDDVAHPRFHSVDSPSITPRMSATSTFGAVRLGVPRGDPMNPPLGLPRASPMAAVIGGGSYTAAHIIVALLNAGYTVRSALVLSAVDKATFPEDIQRHVPPEYRSRLQVLECDLFSNASLQDAIRGCGYVIHCGLHTAPAARDIVDAHVATVTALFAAMAAIGPDKFSRVVLTGSASSCFHPTQPPPHGKGVFDETTRNAVASKTVDVMQFAKMMFEDEAWRLQKASRIPSVTTILPAIVIGPSLTSEVSEAMRTVCDLAQSSSSNPFVPKIYWNFVDVRDVARAHVLALESPRAVNERFVLTAENLSIAELGNMIHRAYPQFKPPTLNAPFLVAFALGPLYNTRVTFAYLWRTLGRRRVLSGAKAKEKLGLQLTTMQDTVRDSLRDLMERGYLASSSTTENASTPTAGAEPGGSGTCVLRATVAAVVAATLAASAAWVWRARSNRR